MLKFFSLPKINRSWEKGQAIVEFAIVLPILVMVLVGILEAGRLAFIYASVSNASRDAARYASAYGYADGTTYNKYQYCYGIRDVAKRAAAPLVALQNADIVITYDNGPGTTVQTNKCTAGTTVDTSVSVTSGDRVTVAVTMDYEPMVSLIPIDPDPITFRSSRTILGVMQLVYP
jgi:Flp pilus assembly protein TadG